MNPLIRKIRKFSKARLLTAAAFALILLQTGIGAASDFKSFGSRLGRQDAAVVADATGSKLLFAHNPDQALIPASTLKLVTALAAFHHLGNDYRFATEFYLDRESNLKIKGFGDPLLLSEVLDDISGMLAEQLDGRPIRNIIIDHTYFQHPIVIPGVTDSSEPYDAPNGALCVNFNTVNFTRSDGKFISAEAQTPLLPMVLERIRASGLAQGRIRLSLNNREVFYYAGNLFKYFLESKGIHIESTVQMGKITPADQRLLVYRSPFTLEQVVQRMMAFSNNFIANQLLIHTGARLFDPPGTLDKALAAARDYLHRQFGDIDIRMAEGSGISRANRVSARSMLAVLDRFKPHRHLLEQEGNDVFKTGTLKDISTRAGYIRIEKDVFYPYAILLNSPGKSAARIAEMLQRILLGHD